MPIPQGPRTFRGHEAQDVKQIERSVFVRGFVVPPGQVRDQVEKRYWAKKGDEGRGATMKKFLKRMASSFIGGGVKEEGVWLPKGELYNNETRLQGAEDAMNYWDNRMNPGFSGEMKISAPSQANE